MRFFSLSRECVVPMWEVIFPLFLFLFFALIFFFNGVIQRCTDNPRGNHGELFRTILSFAEHLRGIHGESVW